MKDKIWLTYKSRIKAEQRFIFNERMLELLLLYYSLFAVSVSVWLLAFNLSNTLANVTFTCFSIFILSLSLYVSAANYSQRAFRMKENYLALSRLIHCHEQNKYTPESIHHEYTRLLNTTENHHEIDFLQAIIDEYRGAKDKTLLSRPPTKQHYLQYYIKKVTKAGGLIILFAIPPILTYVSFSDILKCLQ